MYVSTGIIINSINRNIQEEFNPDATYQNKYIYISKIKDKLLSVGTLIGL